MLDYKGTLDNLFIVLQKPELLVLCEKIIIIHFVMIKKTFFNLSFCLGFSKSLAKEVMRKNIRVNVIAPGFIETDMTSSKLFKKTYIIVIIQVIFR